MEKMAECFTLECINKMNFSNPQKFLFILYKLQTLEQTDNNDSLVHFVIILWMINFIEVNMNPSK